MAYTQRTVATGFSTKSGKLANKKTTKLILGNIATLKYAGFQCVNALIRMSQKKR